MKRLNHEKEGNFFEKINLDAVATMTKEECHVLDEQVKSVMGDVDRLSKMVQEKVSKDLEMLRADLRVCEENKKMIKTKPSA